MKNAHWFILFVMCFHIACGGNPTPTEGQVHVVEDSPSEASIPTSETDQQDKATAKRERRLPSDTIFLEDGTLNGYKLKISKSGSEANPVVLTARHPGKTIITGEISIEIAGSYIQVRDLIFKNIKSVGKGYDPIKFTGDNCSLTNCLIYNTDDFKGGKTYYWVTVDGKQNEIKGNTFVGKENKAPLIYVIADNPNKGQHVISQNLFARIKPLGENGLETIRIGLKTDEPINSGTVVAGNVFHQCDGDLEIISSKSSDNVFKSNLFSQSRGGLTLRWGHDCLVFDNQFISSSNTSIGVRIAGSGHEVYDNRFDLVGGPNAAAIVYMVGSVNVNCGYLPAKNINVVDNEFYGNADWKIMEHENCDEMPHFTTRNNYKFSNGQPKGKNCDYSLETKTASNKRKGNSKILKEIYDMKALEKGTEKESEFQVQMPDLRGLTKEMSNSGFINDWVKNKRTINNNRVGSTLKP